MTTHPCKSDLEGFFSALNEYLMCKIPIPSSSQPLQVRHSLNLHKAGTGAVVAAMMWWYRNNGPTAWAYLAMHGTYGLVWLFKDTFYRDKAWDAPSTLGSFLFMVIGLATFYWQTPLLVISSKRELPTPVLGGCFALYIIGMIFHHGSDVQKHATLSVKKGLITDGFFSICRNPNYLGEILIYSSFNIMASVSDFWFMPWAWCTYVWGTLFLPNWLKKDRSLSRHPGFKEYKSRVPLILPRLFWKPSSEPVRPQPEKKID